MSEDEAVLRVLVLTMTSPALVDGNANSELDHVRGLADRLDVTVLAPRPSGESVPFELEGLDMHWFAYSPRRRERLVVAGGAMQRLAARPTLWLQALLLTAAMFFHASRLHRRCAFDVVDAQLILPCGLVAAALNRLYGVPYVVLSLGVDAFAFSGKLLGHLRREILTRAHRVAGVSAEIAAHVAPDSRRTGVHPLGVDFAALSAVKESRDPEPGRFLLVGRLIEKKGVRVALEAVSLIPDVRLTVIGDGPMRRSLETHAHELAVSERITFLGQRPLSEMFDEFRRAEGLLIPSLVAADGDREGTPRVLVQAVACGVPVICSASHGMRELLEDGETGFLVSPGDSEALAGAIERLRADPAAASDMAAAALRRLEPVLASAAAADRYTRWLMEASVGAAPNPEVS